MSSIIILSIVLSISLFFNGLMYWYSRQVTSKLAFIYDNIGDVSELIANYRVHLQTVYSMEMFYGEPVLEQLIKNSNNLLNELIDYQEKYSLDVVEVADEIELDILEEETIYGEEEEE